MVWLKQLQSTHPSTSLLVNPTAWETQEATYGYKKQDLVYIEACKQRPVKERESYSWRYRVEKVTAQLE
jgi:hypothetical protein